MAFTTATLTHNFENTDGTAASGSLTFQLTKRMTNGTSTVLPGEITANLNGSGALSQAITSNVDAGTIPTDAAWIVTLRILGAPVEEVTIIVPTGGGTVDLMTLFPQDATGG